MSSSNPVTAICPGAYDPVTYGHLDVIRRTAEIFDRVVVGVVRDPQHKATMFETLFMKESASKLRKERLRRKLPAYAGCLRVRE